MTMDDTWQGIGQAAGEVYKYLHRNGQVSMSQLRRELPMARGRIDQAIGWLARESKLEFFQDRRTTFVSIKYD